MKRIVVTGGAGFIGSHLVDILLGQGHEVHVYDNFSYGRRTFLPDNPALRITEGDLTNKEQVTAFITHADPHVIYHLAALHHIPTCENKPDVALRINVEGTQNVLGAAGKLPHLDKIVFASSGAVYDLVEDPLLEDSTPTVPYDIYSVSKLSGEYLMKLWAAKNEKKAHIARIFNTIGGRETNDHLVPEIVEQLLNGKTTIELGNLDPKRSYIDARDTASGLHSIGEWQGSSLFEVFNVGREDEFNVKEIVEMLGEAVGNKLEIVQVPSRMRKVDRKKQQASLQKHTAQTGWKPRYTVREGLQYAVDFAREKRSR